MSGGRKEEKEGTSGETAGRGDERREEGRRRNQRGNCWAQEQAEGGREEKEGTSGETAGRGDERRKGRMSREPVLGRDCPMGVYE